MTPAIGIGVATEIGVFRAIGDGFVDDPALHLGPDSDSDADADFD